MPTLETSLPAIRASFDRQSSPLFRKKQLAQLFKQEHKQWALQEHATFGELLELLIKQTKLKKIALESKDYKSATRYTWGDVSPYLLALSLKSDSYLCHGTAVFLHGLNEQIPRTIYVNKEQTPKPAPTGVLTQDAINKAFANKQRTSNYIFTFDDHRCQIISGKNTGNLGVVSIPGPSGEELPVTDIERTLIDIAVRPDYAGGVYQVLAAYEGALERLSIKKLISTLKKLDYKYPYHQVLGFYLSKAGFDPKKLNPLRELGLDYDFYLGYGMAKQNVEYDPEWRLFFPKGF